MRRHISEMTLVCGALIAMGAASVGETSAAPGQQVSQGQDLTSTVNRLEMAVFGSTSKTKPLAARINNLEIHTQCETQTGTLKSRVEKLVQTVGLGSSTSISTPVSEVSTTTKSTPTVVGKKTEKAPPFAPPIHASHVSKPLTTAAKADEIRKVLVESIRFHQDGKLTDAEKGFKRVLELDPYNADACFSLGSLSEAKGDLTGALGYYSAAAVANPADREAQNAVVQVQERISQQQGPFVNPLSVSNSGSPPLLQARASEFTTADMPQQGVFYPQTPMSASLGTPTFPTGSIRPQQQIPSYNVGQSPPQQRPTSGTGRAVARGLARVAVGAALNASGLHCPLCNILRGF